MNKMFHNSTYKYVNVTDKNKTFTSPTLMSYEEWIVLFNAFY